MTTLVLYLVLLFAVPAVVWVAGNLWGWYMEGWANGYQFNWRVVLGPTAYFRWARN